MRALAVFALAPPLAAVRPDLSPSDSVVFSSGGQHLAMCICAKCGSTSLFSWLYEGIYGAPFDESHHGPPWVQHVPSWGPPPNGAISLSGVPSTGPVDQFTIVRDPLDRYYSAWKSKIRCDRSDTADGNRLVPNLLRRAGLPASTMVEVRTNNDSAPVPVFYCLGFREFALAMRRIHARGEQARLDIHLLPQSLSRCKRDAKRMTIAQFASVAPELSDRFGLRQVVFPHTHAEQTGSEGTHAAETRKELEAELCAIVYPEYDWMGDDTTFARRCPQGTYRLLAESEKRLEGRLLLEADRSEKMPTVEVLRCPSKELLEFTNADKVVREDALIDIFTTHFAPRGSETPDLMFLPTSCGWSDPALQPEDSAPTPPRLGYFAVASMPWGAFPSGRDVMRPLLTQSWPARMAVLSVEVPSYAPSWDGEAKEVKLTPMWKWGGKHPPAAALVIPYISLSPPAVVPTLDDRPALAAFVGTVHNINTGKPDVGRSPLRARLLEECRGPSLKWRDCIFISDHDSGHDSRFNMSVQQRRISREGADGVYDSSHAMVDLSSMAAEAYSKARFTLCPWGDTLTRKSIFDAMMHGSIPVLFDGTVLREYARLGPIENMTVVVPLRAITAQGSGALEYLRALPADRVAQLHDNVVKWRLNFHLPSSADVHVPGDAVDAIVRRIAEHFEGRLTLPPLPTRRGFKARLHKQFRSDREAESNIYTKTGGAVRSESPPGDASAAEGSPQLQSDLELPPFSPHAACEGGCACVRDPLPKPRDTVRFFLHEHGSFDSSDLQLPAEDSDSLPIHQAEHLTDYFLVNALRSHPLRTREKNAATVHVLGALPFTSWVQQPPEVHARRMREMASALAKMPRYLVGVPFVLVMGHWNVQDILGPELLEVMRRGRAILATSDSQFPALVGPLRWLNTVVMPYRAHRLAEAVAFAEDPERTKRPINFMFDGWAARKTRWPALRQTLVKVLQHLPNTNVSDSAVANYGAPHHRAPAPEQALAASRSVATMMATSVCVVPEGDTWTSRRLFEALAVGCVPLLVRGPRTAEETRSDELDLPFRASIDWSQVTLGVMELAPEHALQADVEQHGQSAPTCPLGGAPARPLRLHRARLAAPGSSALPGRGPPATGRPTTASGAQAKSLQSLRSHCL